MARRTSTPDPQQPAHRHADLVELVDKARFDYFLRDSPTVGSGRAS